MLPSRSGILAEAINMKILTKNLPDSLHPHPDSLHFTLVPRILTPNHGIPTLIPRISTLIPCVPTWIPCILTRIPRVPTLIPRVSIILLILFPNFPFRLLQIAGAFKGVYHNNDYFHLSEKQKRSFHNF